MGREPEGKLRRTFELWAEWRHRRGWVKCVGAEGCLSLVVDLAYLGCDENKENNGLWIKLFIFICWMYLKMFRKRIYIFIDNWFSWNNGLDWQGEIPVQVTKAGDMVWGVRETTPAAGLPDAWYFIIEKWVYNWELLFGVFFLFLIFVFLRTGWPAAKAESIKTLVHL